MAAPEQCPVLLRCCRDAAPSSRGVFFPVLHTPATIRHPATLHTHVALHNQTIHNTQTLSATSVPEEHKQARKAPQPRQLRPQQHPLVHTPQILHTLPTHRHIHKCTHLRSVYRLGRVDNASFPLGAGVGPPIDGGARLDRSLESFRSSACSIFKSAAAAPDSRKVSSSAKPPRFPRDAGCSGCNGGSGGGPRSSLLMLADPRLTASVLPTTSASRLRPELAPPRPRPEAPAAGAALPPPPPPRPHAPKLTLLLSSSSSSSSSAASFCASCSDRASKSLRSAASFFAAAVISAMRPESNCPLPVSIVGMSGARTMRASLRFLVVMRRMSGESRASSLSSSLPMTSARSTATPMGSLSDGEATLPSASSFSGSRSNATCDAARDSTRDDALELASPPRAPMPPAAPSPLRSSNTSNLTWARGPAAGGSLSRALVSLPATTAAALPDAEWAGLAVS
eukprot:366573-Chlamydomonas_euryale.AAC.10